MPAPTTPDVEFPGQEPPAPPTARRAAGLHSADGTGLLWTGVVVVAWVALATWQPTTTWHLAPAFLAAAWPWVVGQDLAPGDTSARRRILVAVGGGLVTASGTAFALAGAGLLEGPTFTGPGSVVAEALALATAGAVIAAIVGLLRARPAPAAATARVGSTTIATSEQVVVVEGNAYFPVDAVREGVLQPSRTKTVCPWKGIATYYDVHVDDHVLRNAAWTYRHPIPLARRIRGRVAFWHSVEVSRPGERP